MDKQGVIYEIRIQDFVLCILSFNILTEYNVYMWQTVRMQVHGNKKTVYNIYDHRQMGSDFRR